MKTRTTLQALAALVVALFASIADARTLAAPTEEVDLSRVNGVEEKAVVFETEAGKFGLVGMCWRKSIDDKEGVIRLVANSVLWHEWGHLHFGHTDSTSTDAAEQRSRETSADAVASYWLGWYQATQVQQGVTENDAVADEVIVEAFGIVGELHESSHPDTMNRQKTARDWFEWGMTDGAKKVENAPTEAEIAKYISK